jgi:predicted nucleic acid-binding protein
LNAIFVDSSVWIDHFRGVLTPGVRALQALLVALNPDTGEDEPTQIFMGDLVLLEVLRGILDCLIAAWCIARSVPLLHNDRDFLPFATHCGLQEFALGAAR